MWLQRNQSSLGPQEEPHLRFTTGPGRGIPSWKGLDPSCAGSAVPELPVNNCQHRGFLQREEDSWRLSGRECDDAAAGSSDQSSLPSHWFPSLDKLQLLHSFWREPSLQTEPVAQQMLSRQASQKVFELKGSTLLLWKGWWRLSFPPPLLYSWMSSFLPISVMNAQEPWCQWPWLGAWAIPYLYFKGGG